jgi:hypothetical protein
MAANRNDGDECGAIIAFRCPQDLVAAAESAAAAEGISKSDVARRALMRDLRRPQQGERVA